MMGKMNIGSQRVQSTKRVEIRALIQGTTVKCAVFPTDLQSLEALSLLLN